MEQVFKFTMEGLTCAGCTQKILKALKTKHPDTQFDYSFANGELVITNLPQEAHTGLRSYVQGVVNQYEDGVYVIPKGEDVALLEVENQSRGFRLTRPMRIGIGAVAFTLSIVSELIHLGSPWVLGSFYLATYLIVGYPVLLKALKNILRGQVFDENLLMTVATLGAIGLGEMPEAVGVMLFYELGEFFQDLAVSKSRREIQKLLAIRPDQAHLVIGDVERDILARNLAVGDRVRVKPGECVPIDGRILRGEGHFDTAALTGESVPRRFVNGDELLSGFICGDAVVEIEVTRPFEKSTASRLIELVEGATEKKAKAEQFMTVFARYYTPTVMFLALFVATAVPLVLQESFTVWLYRALIFLVISCPCALVISIPLGYFGGLGAASRQGVLVKGGNYLDVLARLDHVVFDKTGTLTQGDFEVQAVHVYGDASDSGDSGDSGDFGASRAYNPEEVLFLAANAEIHSSHPIGKAVVRRAMGLNDQGAAEVLKGVSHLKAFVDFKEYAGLGVEASCEIGVVSVGKYDFVSGGGKGLNGMNAGNGGKPFEGTSGGAIIYVGLNHQVIGAILVSDALRNTTEQAVKQLSARSIEMSVLSGDRVETVASVAKQLGIARHYGDLTPKGKLETLEGVMVGRKGATAFVGDGINDAPVLARADIGIAMGGMGSQVAIETADVVLMSDDLCKLDTGIAIAKKTRFIVYENILLAIGVKVVFLSLGMVGLSGMWEAIFADVGVALLAVLNASRVIAYKPR